jgi:hypothetical protein
MEKGSNEYCKMMMMTVKDEVKPQNNVEYYSFGVPQGVY